MKILYLTLALLLSITLVAQDHATPAAQFDVIIKTNGDIIYGKVMEVTFDLVKYKRTDIPDGPIYQLLKSEVYAISYRNQLKEILNPGGFSPPASVDNTAVDSVIVDETEEEKPSIFNKSNIHSGEARFGLGFIPSYSKVSNRDSYDTKIGFPTLIGTYLIPYKRSMLIGLQVAYGSFKYNRSQFDDYDGVQTETSLKENLFMITALGKYAITQNDLRPYVLLGLSYNISSVDAESTLNFIDDDREIFVKSGVRNTGVGFLARAGLEYSLNEKIGFYADLGTGATLLQLGGIFKLNK